MIPHKQQCGIPDFTFADLYKPEYPRLRRIFSYIINFIRFRESQTSIIDAHFNKSERTKLRIESLYDANATASQHLAQLERQKRATDAALSQKEKRAADLKARLLELKRGQERVAERMESCKADSTHLKKTLEDKTARNMDLRTDVAKLRPYTEQSPQALEDSLRTLSTTLAEERSRAEKLDRRARALQQSAESFVLLNTDVLACARLLGDVGAEISKEDEEKAKAARHRDALSDRSNNVRDVERQERLLRKQLGNVGARTEKLKRAAEDRAEAARGRMEELRVVHEEVRRERGERGRDVERRRVRIEQVEKKMVDLKENVEGEVAAAREEYRRMESHIQLYVREMEGCLGEETGGRGGGGRVV